MNSESSSFPQPAFLAYSSRSGSTFLATNLAERYAVAVVPEFQSAYWLLGQPAGRQVSAESLDPILQADRQLTWASKRSLGSALESGRATPGELLLELGRTWVRKTDNPSQTRLLFKLGGVMGIWPDLDRHFPDSRVLNVIRDGRAVANSLLRSPRPYGGPGNMGRGDYVHCAKQWDRQVSSQTILAQLMPERIYQVRYESFMRDFECELASIAEYFAWPAGGSGGFSVAETERKIHQDVSGSPRLERSEAWRSELPRRARIVVEVIASETLRSHGYTDLLVDVGQGERMRALAIARAHHVRVASVDSTRRLLRIKSPAVLASRISHRWRARRAAKSLRRG